MIKKAIKKDETKKKKKTERKMEKISIVIFNRKRNQRVN